MDATSPALGRSRAPASPLSRPRISSCASVDRDTSRAASTRLLLPPECAAGSARPGAGGSPRGLGRGDPELGGQPWPLKEGRKGDLAHNLWVLAPGRERAGDAVAGRRVLMLRGLGGTMPFPPPPVPAPGVPAARPPPRRPAAPRKLAATTCAPPGPSPPAAAGEKKRRPPERPEVLPARSWPSATLKRPPARRAPGPAPPRTPAAPGRPHTPVTAGAGDSPAGSAASGPGPDAAVRFSLSLTPEAVLVIQRRHLEKQLLARPRRPLPSPSADARRLLTPGPRARAAGPRRSGDPGGLDARPPGFPRLPGGPQAPDPCLRRLLKVSLLNDRHKYDDVEYEEEPAAVDESLVRKCTEWLRGVESAAASRDGTGPLDALPHLSTL